MDGLSVVQMTRIREYQNALYRRDAVSRRPDRGHPDLEGLRADLARDVGDAEEHLRALGLDPDLAQLVKLTSLEQDALRGDR